MFDFCLIHRHENIGFGKKKTEILVNCYSSESSCELKTINNPTKQSRMDLNLETLFSPVNDVFCLFFHFFENKFFSKN